MTPRIEPVQPLLMLAEDRLGGVVNHAYLSDVEQHVKILAMLKARDVATRSDVESVGQLLRSSAK